MQEFNNTGVKAPRESTPEGVSKTSFINNGLVVQKSLAIGAVDDPLEREADQMADQVMRMPEPSLIQRKCDACKEEEQVSRKPLAHSITPFIQKKAGEQGRASEAVSNQIQASRGSRGSLPASTKSFMESRFGTDFSSVKIHTDNQAIQMSQELNAQAFTVGSDIYFNEGKYSPESDNGKHLLAHELTHVLQQNQKGPAPNGNRPTLVIGQKNSNILLAKVVPEQIAESGKESNAIPFIQRAPAPFTSQTSAPSFAPFTSQTSSPSLISSRPRVRYRPTGSISRTEFDNYVRSHFGVSDVHTGTQPEQERRITRLGVPTPTIPTWQTWDPGSTSDDYAHIINGIEDMVDALGAIPQITTILFFETYYEPNAITGIGTAIRDIGATFGGGQLVIFEAFHGTTNPAIGRSTAHGTPRRPNNRADNIRYIMIHELGHGVAEAGSNRGPEMFNLYNQTVGWLGHPLTLYDIQQPAVQDAIRNNTPLPAAHIITASRWNDPTVMEQPMSEYAVSDGPGEDFAESMAAYVTNPIALLARSPSRHQFFTSNMATWKTRMRNMAPSVTPPMIGDFPAPPHGLA